MVLVVIFGVTAIAVAGMTHVTVLGIIAGVIATAGYYRYDVRRHPKVACRVCGGSGDKASRIGGGVLRRPRGPCGHCGGKKAFPRPALRVLDTSRRERIMNEITRARKSMKR